MPALTFSLYYLFILVSRNLLYVFFKQLATNWYYLLEDVFHESAKPNIIEEMFYCIFLDDSEKQEKTHLSFREDDIRE